jgi:phage baseplate assembly protein gpV
MRVPVIVATLAVALAMAGQSAAAQSMKSSSSKPAATHGSVAGKLQSYDAATKTLKIKAGKGEQEFTLANNAVVRQGAKTLTADELASHEGQTVKVRYTVANNQKTADSITIAGMAPHAASAKK